MTELRCVLCPTRKPRRATLGQACEPCRDRVDERLADIAVLHGFLPELLLPGAGPQDGGKRGKAAAAPLPVRVDVLNLLGPVADVHVRYNLDALGDLQCQHGPMSTFVVLDILAETAREQIGLDPGPVGQTVNDLVVFLRRQLDRICNVYDPLRQFNEELWGAYNVLRDVCAEHRKRPVGTCPEIVDRDGTMVVCGATLSASTYHDDVQCPSCHRRWSRDDLEWLGRTMGALA